MFLVYSFNLLKKEKSKVIKTLTSMSIHSPLDKASSIAASTWPCKDSPTQHVGRNFTGNLWNLLFRNCLPSVIPRRDNASYSKQKKIPFKHLLLHRERTSNFEGESFLSHTLERTWHLFSTLYIPHSLLLGIIKIQSG